MKKKDPLFELIQSLTMSEKRYFKIFGQRHMLGETKNYLELFDACEKMSEYDELELLRLLKVENVEPKYLSADKNHLYNLVLRSLSSFHSGRTVSLKVKELIHQIDILYEKSLYNQCIQLLKRGKKLADKYDLYALYVELSNWEQRVLIQLEKTEEVKESLTDAAEHMAKLDNIHAFMQLYYRMYGIAQRIPNARSEEETAELEEFISHPFLKDESIARSFQAKLQFWKIYSLYHQSSGNTLQELEAYRRLLELMDSNEKYAQEFPFDYISIYNRILSIKRYSSDTEFEPVVNDVFSFPEKLSKARKNVELRLGADYYENIIRRNIYFGRISECLQSLPEQQQFFKRYRNQFSEGEILEFEYLFAYIYLLNGKHKESLHIVNRLINETDDKLRPDIQSYIRILNLAIHYELNNFSVMKYAAERAYRYLKKRKLLHSTERFVLRLFQELVKKEGMGVREIQQILRKYHGRLEEIFQDPYERKSLEYFDSISWLEAKIRKKDFEEVRKLKLAEDVS
ncbi:MAG: hypothetical protein MRZ79_06600 [Bacteroidia bacterium]|nr:hypothetical protein [Bacteroidia bacterium]